MLGARVACPPQDRQHIGRNGLQLERFLNELRQAVLNAHTWAEIAHQYRALHADQFHAGADFIDGGEVLG